MSKQHFITYDPRTEYGKYLKECPECLRESDYRKGFEYNCCCPECESEYKYKIGENLYELWDKINWDMAHDTDLPQIIFNEVKKLNEPEFEHQLINEAKAHRYYINN